MDAEKSEFKDGAFDIVAASMVTHHMPHWEKAFQEMVRVLRPGGYLIYTDLMLPSWLAVLRRLLPFVGIPTKNRVEFLATQAGLTSVYQANRGLQSDFIWVRNR